MRAGEAQPAGTHAVVPSGAVCQEGFVVQLHDAQRVTGAAVRRWFERGRLVPGSVVPACLRLTGEEVTAGERFCCR